MIDEKRSVPLSPPNSPRMSDKGTKPDEYRWQQPQIPAIQPASATLPPVNFGSGHGPLQNTTAFGGDQARPPLRSHKSFPYSLGPSSRLQHEVTLEQPEAAALEAFKEKVVSQGPQPVGTPNQPPATFGGSAPTSPAGRLTPHSPDAEIADAPIDDEEIGFDAVEHADEQEQRPPLTAAELRAQKRKMKRFR
jgi:hypothetical protein